jgi:hypothetical protein
MSIARTGRFKILTWSIAWGTTGIGLLGADVFSEPRDGALWIGIVPGMVSWSVAGALTYSRARISRSAPVWALAYLMAFWLGAVWGSWFEQNVVGSISSAGFIGALLGWAVGASFAVLASEYIDSRRKRHAEAFASAVVWGISFLIGGYLAMIAAMFLAQLASIAFPGAEQIAIYVGWGFGCALAGALASATALTARSFTDRALQVNMLRTIALFSFIVVYPAATASAQSDTVQVVITLERASPSEQATANELRQLLRKYEVSDWIFTRKVHIDERSIPHSHPLLTLHTRHLGDEHALLATFLHEQFHWLEEGNDNFRAAMDAFAKAYPDAPARGPEGARDLESTYRHLLVCDLEFQAITHLLGVERARAVLSASRHYTWIYDRVLNDPRVRTISTAHGFLLNGSGK